MRLKGGKVLLDLTGYGVLSSLNGVVITLSKEENIAILEKGLSLLVKTSDSYGKSMIMIFDIVFLIYSQEENYRQMDIGVIDTNGDNYKFSISHYFRDGDAGSIALTYVEA